MSFFIDKERDLEVPCHRVIPKIKRKGVLQQMKLRRSLMALFLIASTIMPSVSFASTNYASYVIKKGDSLSSLAKRYHTTITQLKEWNHLSSNTIYAGEKLMVSAPSKPVRPIVSKPAAKPSTSTNAAPVVPAQPASKPATTSPANSVTKPSNPAPPSSPASLKIVSKEVLGFTVQYSSTDMTSYTSMENHENSITSIATATHVVDGFGNLTGTVPAEQLRLAVSSGITPTLMIGNNFNSSIASSLLENPANRQNMVNNTLSTLKTYGYKGVNIDIENIPAKDRDNYTALIRELSASLKPLGYTVSASVSAKTVDSPNYAWTYGYDYKALVPYVDYLLIMAYDEHYLGGDPGPIASIGWVTNVVNYALTVVPKDKILLGVASYGYDWGQGLPTRSYGINKMISLAQSYNAPIVFDNVTKSPHFDYTDSNGAAHHVWFEDAESLSYKLDLVNSKGLRGIGIWRLGLENDDDWNMINSKLK